MTTTNSNLESAINAYVAILQERANQGQSELTRSTYGVEQGRRYAKIFAFTSCGGRSAVCFVDSDGSILKSASWKAPAKGIRGNVFNLATAPATRGQMYW